MIRVIISIWTLALLLYLTIILIPFVAIMAGAFGLDAVVSNIRIAPLILTSIFFLGSALSCFGHIYHTESRYPGYYIPRVLALFLFSFAFIWNFGSPVKARVLIEDAIQFIFVDSPAPLKQASSKGALSEAQCTV
jgi:hypothetical protein